MKQRYFNAWGIESTESMNVSSTPKCNLEMGQTVVTRAYIVLTCRQRGAAH